MTATLDRLMRIGRVACFFLGVFLLAFAIWYPHFRFAQRIQIGTAAAVDLQAPFWSYVLVEVFRRRLH